MAWVHHWLRFQQPPTRCASLTQSCDQARYPCAAPRSKIGMRRWSGPATIDTTVVSSLIMSTAPLLNDQMISPAMRCTASSLENIAMRTHRHPNRHVYGHVPNPCRRVFLPELWTTWSWCALANVGTCRKENGYCAALMDRRTILLLWLSLSIDL